jgi:hypothetical protein
MLQFHLLPYTLAYAASPFFGSNEFYIALKKDACIQNDEEATEKQILQISETLFNLGKFSELRRFAAQYDSIYVYSSVAVADRILSSLGIQASKCNGLLISQEFNKPQFTLPVYNPEEINPLIDQGIIVAMIEESSIVVEKHLRTKGFENIYCARVDE